MKNIKPAQIAFWQGIPTVHGTPKRKAAHGLWTTTAITSMCIDKKKTHFNYVNDFHEGF